MQLQEQIDSVFKGNWTYTWGSRKKDRGKGSQQHLNWGKILDEIRKEEWGR